MAQQIADAVAIPVQGGQIAADLRCPEDAAGLVIFAHGSGSSRASRRNRAVAACLETRRFATLLLDLLTIEEEDVDRRTTQFRFDIALLGDRVIQAIDWLAGHHEVARLPVGCFGASTGAAAALVAAAERPSAVHAVVSRGGRPDLAAGALARVQAPTLLIVGGDDAPVLDVNHDAMRQMRGLVQLEVIPGATHLFEEPGTLEQVMHRAAHWFDRYLLGPALTGPLRAGG